MTLSGMVVDSILDVGRQLQAQAEALDRSTSAIDRLVRTAADSWRGADLDQFRSRWEGEYRRTTMQAAANLKSLGETARRNAESQRETSADLGATPASAASIAAWPTPHLAGDLGKAAANIWDDLAQGWNWLWTSDADREKALSNMAASYAKEKGIEPPPKVVFEEIPAPPGYVTHGQFDSSTNTLTINSGELGDKDQMINTLYHEMRHAEQHQVVNDLADYRRDPAAHPWTHPDVPIQTAEAWRDNFANYVTQPYDQYRAQPVEVDARDAGQRGLDDMTNDKLNGYKK